ncbi:MAG TPA: hypothetical protein VF581_07770 [Flavobacterium sp.]|jgi:hypothetical protein
MSEFNLLLYRPLKSGNQFNDLIPKSTCKSKVLGDGMTDFSIIKIEETINEFYWQLEEVAEVIQTSSLENNVKAIKEFAYSHFQYKADDQIQQLRTPACSWYARRDGIDCKSYSIIASCLLLNMGITHYIRKIKQPGYEPTEWTHVYVVVPKDQATGSMNNGYYTIDGTLKTDREPAFIEKSDIIMRHHQLNGPTPALGFSFGEFGIDDIKGMLSNIDCLGGTGFDGDKLKMNAELIEAHFKDISEGINSAISTKDFALLSSEVNEYFGSAKLFVSGYEKKKTLQNWNSCSKKNFDAAIRISKFYRDSVCAALTAYLNQYFTRTAAGSKTFSHPSQYTWDIGNLWLGEVTTVTEPKFNYAIKAEVQSIPKFEITPYVAGQLDNPSSFNTAQFLQSLASVATIFTAPGQNPNFPNSNNPINPGTGLPYSNIDQEIQPDKAGMGVLGYAMLGGAVYLAYKAITDPPKGKSAKPANK